MNVPAHVGSTKSDYTQGIELPTPWKPDTLQGYVFQPPATTIFFMTPGMCSEQAHTKTG